MSLRSFVASSERDGQDFTIHNLPLGIGQVEAGVSKPCICSRIGDEVLNLSRCADLGLLNGPILSQQKDAFTLSSLNGLASLGADAMRELRVTMQRLLSDREGMLRDNLDLRSQVLHQSDHVKMELPFAIGDYTDFYASRQHAENVGKIFGRDPPLMPNWTRLPVAYHGRASSVVVSGTEIKRPR